MLPLDSFFLLLASNTQIERQTLSLTVYTETPIWNNCLNVRNMKKLNKNKANMWIYLHANLFVISVKAVGLRRFISVVDVATSFMYPKPFFGASSFTWYIIIVWLDDSKNRFKNVIILLALDGTKIEFFVTLVKKVFNSESVELMNFVSSIFSLPSGLSNPAKSTIGAR